MVGKLIFYFIGIHVGRAKGNGLGSGSASIVELTLVCVRSVIGCFRLLNKTGKLLIQPKLTFEVLK